RLPSRAVRSRKKPDREFGARCCRNRGNKENEPAGTTRRLPAMRCGEELSRHLASMQNKHNQAQRNCRQARLYQSKKRPFVSQNNFQECARLLHPNRAKVCVMLLSDPEVPAAPPVLQ